MGDVASRSRRDLAELGEWCHHKIDEEDPDPLWRMLADEIDSYLGSDDPVGGLVMEPLFAGFDAVPESVELTEGQRLRLRQRGWLDAGRHPLTKLPLLAGEHTCRDCVHRVRNERHYPKCELTSMSHCVQSDCRAWWPACTGWEAKPDPSPP